MENNQAEQMRGKKIVQIENSLWELSDSVKHNNISIIGISEEERNKGTENVFEEIIFENFPNLEKETEIQIKEAQRSSKKKKKKNKKQNKNPQPKEVHSKTHSN